jgi:hypothetical protein
MFVKLLKNIFLILIFLVFLSFFGCKPTYSSATLEKQTEQKIKQEVGYKCKALLIGKTFYVFTDFRGKINPSLTVSNDIFESIQNIMLIVTNISLSTDADIKFFSVVIIDSSKGVKIVFKQYVEDVQKWFYGLVSRDDFFSRSLTDISMTKKNYVFNKNDFPEIKMTDFILEQTIYRMKNNIKLELENLEKEGKKIEYKKVLIKNKKDQKYKKEFAEKYKQIVDINKKIKDIRFLEIYLTNALVSKKYVNSKEGKKYFEYNFKTIDSNNFFEIDYKKLAKQVASVNKEICEIYKFSKHVGIVVKEDQNILYSNI